MKTLRDRSALLFGITLCGLASLADAAPTVSLSAPANAALYLAPATLAVSASVTPSAGTTIARVDFYQGSTLIGTDTTTPYSVTWSNAPAGSYSLTAKATDSAGGVTTSAARSITVNATNTLPTVSLSAPAANARYLAPASVTLTASASGVETNTPISKVEFYQGTTWVGTATASPYSMLWRPPAAGSYNLTAKATDSAGGVTTSAARAVTIQPAAAAQVYYLHTDHLNTPRLVTDETNTVLWRAEPLAEPFGMSPPEDDPDQNGTPFTLNLRFPGQYADQESNLNYNYLRDGYNSATGSYTQSDPIGLAGGINTYGYVGGNPLGFTDPFGLYKYNAPAPRTVPVQGETEGSLSCLEQCLRVTTRSPKLELLVTGGAETKGHSKNSRHYTGEACDIAPLKATDDQVNDCASRCGFRGGQFETFPDNPRRNHYHFQQEPGNGVPRLTPFTPDP